MKWIIDENMIVTEEINKLEDIISALRDSDLYIKHIFTQGGCYKFFLFIKTIYPDAEPYIDTNNKDHVVVKLFGRMFDIRGILRKELESFYSKMSDEDIKIAESWSFSKNQALQLRECPHCGEPIIYEENL